jgi:periplasmic divalent cation tolerance protein
METTNYLLVMTTCPSREVAERLANQVLGQHLVACVNMLPAMQSWYFYEEELMQDQEILMLMKTREDCYPHLQALLLQLHPYEEPEIIALPIQTGSPTYFAWMDNMLINKPKSE